MNFPKPNGSLPTARGEWNRILREDPIARGAVAIGILSVVLTVGLWHFRTLPYYWDAVGYVFSHSQQVTETNLFPILTTWDVGHPTLFFFSVAILMKLFGIGPVAGHLATWVYAAILLVALYGCGRALTLPKPLCAATCLLVLSFPLTFASTLQITLDLPMTALLIASIWFWARGRWLGYFVVGSLACLVKLYGFLLVPSLIFGLVAARVFTPTRYPFRRFLREVVYTSSPLITIGLFIIARELVRGPGLTINWESGNKPIPIWDWPAFVAYFPTAFDQIFTASMLDRVLVFTTLMGSLCVAASATGYARRLTVTEDCARMLAACAGIAITFSLAFFQSLSLCARYNLPSVCALFLVMSFCLWFLVRNVAGLMTVYALAAFAFIASWHPRIAAAMPTPLKTLLQRPPEVLGYRFENDLRFLDVIDLSEWAAKQIDRDAKQNHRLRAVSTNWPFNIGFADERFGYVEKRLNTHPANSWAEVEGSRHPYVLILRPVSEFLDQPPPPDNPYVAHKIKERVLGDATAEIWLVEKNKSATITQ